MRQTRSDPGDFAGRLARVRTLDRSPAIAEPLSFLTVVLEHQRERAVATVVRSAAARVAEGANEARTKNRWPLLNLDASTASIGGELLDALVALGDHPAVPDPLRDAGRGLLGWPDGERTAAVSSWLDDSSLLHPRVALWIRVAAAPVLELAAVQVSPPGRDEWAGRACPMCGDSPQCSAIVEESAAFLQGAPRYLVCGRCATWWAWPRSVCPWCGEDDSRRLGPYTADGLVGARIDACDTCMSYIKSFDLRADGAGDIVPLVDDIATLTLDVWAHEQGLSRPTLSLAGV